MLASRQTLFWMEKLMKFVSTSTWYGGPSAVLYLKKSAEEVLGLQNIQAHLLVPLNISSFKDCGHKTFALALDWGRTVSSRESVPFSLHKCTYHWTINTSSKKLVCSLYIIQLWTAHVFRDKDQIFSWLRLPPLLHTSKISTKNAVFLLTLNQ